MGMTENGVSTCRSGEEKYEKFRIGKTGRVAYQYDFRTVDGELFSTVRPSLEACREARDKWLAERS